MDSPNRPYVSQVDEIRGLAALLVLFFHCLIIGYWRSGHTGWIDARNPVEALLIEGHSGVSLFMVLSGYILARGTWGRSIAYGDFLLNRIIRIFPLMTLVVVAAVYAKTSITMGQIFAPFLLVQNILPLSLTEPSGIAGTVWTISVEFQFYLVAPFLFIFVGRYGFLGYVLPFVAFIVCMRAFVQFEHRAEADLLWQYPYFSIIGRIDQFIVGIYLARRWESILASRRLGWLGPGALAFGVLGMMLLSYAENLGGGQYAWHWWRVPQQEIEAVLWGSFVAGYIIVDPLSRVPRVRAALRSVGIISFSLYILHWPVLTGVYDAIPLLGFQVPERHAGVLAIAAGVILPLVVGASTLSYLCVERPFLHLRRRYVGPAVAPGSAA